MQSWKLRPSNAEWRVLQICGFLPPIENLIGKACTKPDVTKCCHLKDLEINQLICSNSDPTNEGQPTLLCGNFIAHIVGHTNTALGNQSVKFVVYPVVREETDRRENDYSIFKIVNRITYIVVEVKLSIGARLTMDDQDKLAQLFLEAIYIFAKEGKSKENSVILCVLTDGTTWHMIKTHMNQFPLHFESIFTCSTTSGGAREWDFNLGTICDQFVGHVKAHQATATVQNIIHNSPETEP